MTDRPRPSDLTRTVRTKIHECGCGCWVWTGAVDRYGYAAVKMRGVKIKAHRYAWERCIGPLEPDQDIDHLCDRHRNCVNPDHMEPVTRSENSQRANQRRWHDASPDTSRCTPIPTQGESNAH